MIAMPRNLSSLERCLVAEAHRRYAQFGFPAAKDVCVSERMQDDAGRITKFSHDGVVSCEDGATIIGQVELGVDGPLLLGTLYITNGKLDSLGLIVVGNEVWLGDEPGPFNLWTA